MKLKKRLGCSFSMFRPMRPLSTRRSTHRLQIDYFLFDRHRQTTVGSEEQDTNSLIPALVIHAAIYYSSAIVVAIVIRLLCWQPNHRSRPTGNFLFFFFLLLARSLSRIVVHLRVWPSTSAGRGRSLARASFNIRLN